MKKLFTSYIHFVGLLVSSLLVIFMSACSDELEQSMGQSQTEEITGYQTAPATLSVFLDKATTRLIFEETDYEGRDAFKSVWSEGDGFRLIGTTEGGSITEDPSRSMDYLLAYGAGTTEGLFSSQDTPISGSMFSIYYPYTLSNYSDYALFSYEGQVQQGNDNYDHLAGYHAMRLGYTRDLDNIAFNVSDDHFSQSSCMKFILSGLPKAFVPVSLRWSIVDAEGNTMLDVLPESNYPDYTVAGWTLGLEGFSSTNSLTAYLMMSDQDVTLPSGAQMRVSITGSNREYYYADKPAGGKTIQGGYLNTLTITEGWKTIYESTDNSSDGEVTALQIAEQGEEQGIDVVIVGDGFSDRLIADGTYDEVMQKAYEDFFSIEPYLSYKEKFNVYQIRAVSKHEDMEYADRETAFGCVFGEGTHVEGDHEGIQNFVKEALNADDERMNSLLIIVMINSPRYAGTCWMFGYTVNDFGDGIAIAYVPTGTSDTERRSTLLHECGHGFAKLADEYGTSFDNVVMEDYYLKFYRNEFGWNKNVDVTDDPNEVYWKDFLGDTRYPEISIFEGAYGYANNFYRPTESSIMRDNVGEFNAPSRRAIFYRINKLLNPDFVDSYDVFVEWDATRNRVQHPATGSRSVVRKDFVPLAPPIVQIGYWKGGKFVTE